MTWNEIAENWPALVPSLQSRWPDLAEDDLLVLPPNRAALSKAVVRATGSTPEDAMRDVDDWAQGPLPSDAYADPLHVNAATRDSARYIPEGEDPMSDDHRFGDDNQAERPMGRQA